MAYDIDHYKQYLTNIFPYPQSTTARRCLFTANLLCHAQFMFDEIKGGFDIDTAIGNQLDILGLWIGVSRFVNIDIVNLYFEWGNASAGWDVGVWKGAFDPGEKLQPLSDNAYRQFLKFQIELNKWDATIEGTYKVYDVLFAGTNMSIQITDNYDMTVTYNFFNITDSLIKTMIEKGYYLPKPMGVMVNIVFQ